MNKSFLLLFLKKEVLSSLFFFAKRTRPVGWTPANNFVQTGAPEGGLRPPYDVAGVASEEAHDLAI
jgi:hypothetical protein